jgi:hypothetical protein
VLVGVLYAQRLLERAVARTDREQATQDALEAVDWEQPAPTQAMTSFLDTPRAASILERIAQNEALRLDAEWADMNCDGS